MSNLYLPLTLIGTFLAAAFVGLSVQLSVAGRRRAVRLLEAQVGGSSSSSADLWGEELSRPFWERVVRPFGQGIASLGRRITPIGARERIERKLALAGSPAGWDVEKVAAVKAIGLVVGIALGI